MERYYGDIVRDFDVVKMISSLRKEIVVSKRSKAGLEEVNSRECHCTQYVQSSRK